MLAAFSVHALADSPQLFPETELAAVLALVMALRSVSGPLLPGRLLPASVRSLYAGAGRVVAVALPLALVAALLPLWVWTSRAHASYDRAIRLAREERWPEAVTAAQQAVDRDGRMPAYWFQLGAAHASAAIDGDRRREQEAARSALQRGLALEPHNGAAAVNEAALNVALDRPDVARAALPNIARLAGRDSLLLLAHATLTQWTAPPEQAVETYAGLLVLNPSLAGTPFWEDGGFRAANFNRIVDRALVRVSEVAGSGAAADSLRTAIQVYAGRTAPSAEALSAAVAARPDDVGLRVAAGRLLLSDGTPESRVRAFALLDGAVKLKGDDPGARSALGDYYAAAGDTERARRQWLAAMHLGDLPAAVALGESYRPGPVPRAVAQRAEALLTAAELERFYLIFQTYRFTFQRAEAVPIVLPGDWLTALPRELPRWRATVEGWR
jgi:Flp pilus assembly protein TadD